MSSIDRNTIGGERHIQPANGPNKTNPVASIAQLAASEIRQPTGKKKIAGLKRMRRAASLRSVKSIEAADTDGLSGVSNEQMLGDLARILTIMEIEDERTGGDEVSQLCRVMLEENARRVSLLIESKQTR